MRSRILASLLCLVLLASCREAAPETSVVPIVDTTSPDAPQVDARVAEASAGSGPSAGERAANVLDVVLRADDTLETAQARLGSANVEAREIHAGEGEMVPGWVLFPDDPQRRIDVFLDEDGKHPVRLRVTGERSAWRRSDGVRLGLTSVQLQSMNGKPFELTGFHWDYEGTIIDWRGGRFPSGEASLGFVRLCAPTPEPEGYPLGEGGVLSDMAILVMHPPSVCEFGVQFRPG